MNYHSALPQEQFEPPPEQSHFKRSIYRIEFHGGKNFPKARPAREITRVKLTGRESYILISVISPFRDDSLSAFLRVRPPPPLYPSVGLFVRC